jgi:peptidoglycan LD-endopeptidase CwlK
MAKFSESSLTKLNTCHPDIISVCNKLIERYDFFVAEGHRGEKEQNEAYEKGFSKLKFPFGNHNKYPSDAVDIYPYPFNFSDKSVQNINRCYYLAGHFMGIADMLYDSKIITSKFRWGGDWNSNDIFSDESFRDLGHFEIVKATK